MGVIVTFDPQAFLSLFPQFSNIDTATLTGFVYPLATQYVRNDGGGPVANPQSQTNLLNLCVAHLCQLFWPDAAGNPASGLAGQITSATQGSVSVSVAAPTNPNAEWFYQTKFGAALWQAMAPYRTARYLPMVNPQGQGFVQYPWGAGGVGGYGRR